MNIKSCLAAASLCLLPLCSQAGVIYEWTASNEARPWGITLELEFDRRTVNNGTFVLDFHGDDSSKPAPRRGLLNLRYTYPGQTQLTHYSAKQGGFDDQMGWIHMSVAFGKDGFLTGSIEINDQFQDIDMVSSGREFTVLRAAADEPMIRSGCDLYGQAACSGATGYIQRVSEVPEPASMALLVLGAAGLASARRRKPVR